MSVLVFCVWICSLKCRKGVNFCKNLFSIFCIIKSACLPMSVLKMKLIIPLRKSDKYTRGKVGQNNSENL